MTREVTNDDLWFFTAHIHGGKHTLELPGLNVSAKCHLVIPRFRIMDKAGFLDVQRHCAGPAPDLGLGSAYTG